MTTESDVMISYNDLLARLRDIRKKLEAEKLYGWEFEVNGINAAILAEGTCRIEARHREEAKDERK